MKFVIALILSTGMLAGVFAQRPANQTLPRSTEPANHRYDGYRSQLPSTQHLSGKFDLNVGIDQFSLDDLSSLSPGSQTLKVAYQVYFDERDQLRIVIRPERPVGIFVHLVDPKGKSMSHMRHPLTRQGNNLQTIFTLRQLPPGTYYIQFVNAEGTMIHQVPIRKN